jgi:hypothetical protein
MGSFLFRMGKTPFDIHGTILQKMGVKKAVTP